ncbi:MAG: DUF3147 family protein [SAR86 cluster bacterium]|nr:DUF3147 family protein [SAR86 cluster bacterium]
MYIIFKIIITVFIVVAISEITKRSTALASLLASVPLVSILAISWIYFETKDIGNIINLSKNILILIPPSLIFFIILPMVLYIKIDFIYSLLISISMTIIFYGIYIYLLKTAGINII